jgi:sulfur relay (sulfurtransferase) complex TusBCD TusD component (DsrE family)
LSAERVCSASSSIELRRAPCVTVYLAKQAVAKTVHGIGFQPLPELIEKVVQAKIPVFVWGACSVARGVTEEDRKTGKRCARTG